MGPWTVEGGNLESRGWEPGQERVGPWTVEGGNLDSRRWEPGQ